MNWGWKLAIGSALFMSMIIYFVVQSFQNETHLVSKDYYEEELNFQNKLNATKNAKNLKLDSVLLFTVVENQIQISYPNFFVGNGSEGEVLFYKPSNSNHDRTFACDLNKAYQAIAKSNLEPGPYFAKTTLKKDGKEYFFEKRLTVK